MPGDARKRNARCKNKICACTGECFVDDGTGDFATPLKLERNKKGGLKRLTRAQRVAIGLDKQPENSWSESDAIKDRKSRVGIIKLSDEWEQQNDN